MKNLQTILNAAFGIALLFLIFKQFNGSTGESSSSATNPKKNTRILVADSGNTMGAVAFVNTDTLLEKFDSFKAMRASFDKKGQQAESELCNRMRALE